TDSYYDLLPGEARQASYIAIARGQAPRSHWRRLGRVLASMDGRSGMASWTGTMFEYFMPHLLMPCPENSLLYESVRFALYCQRRRGDERGIPWGISESCFFAFDGALNYQYKAHGIPRLAYKRGLGQEMVVSPYSTFLALQAAPREAVENLRRFQRMGLEGRYGLFEAADFTPSRLSANSGFMAVKCFMSHHLGMSLLAAGNVLCDNIMQKRFMRDPEMGAYHELLEEKAPVGGVVMKPRGQEVPEKPARGVVTGWRREFEGIDVFYPHCTLLSNSAYTLFCTDAGLTASHSSGMELTRFASDQSKWGLGWQFFIENGGLWTGLTAAPLMCGHARYSAVFDVNSVCWDMRGESLHTRVTARVPRDERGELRSVTLTNTGKTPVRLELYAYLEPVLAGRAEYDSHPAFSKLFLQCFRKGQNIRVTRRPRGGGEMHLVVSCDALEAESETSREKALPRGNLFPRGVFRRAAPGDGESGVEPDPCVMLRVPVRLQPGASRIVRFSMAAAATAADAETAAVRILRIGDDAETAGADGAMRMLGLSSAEAHGAMDWLTDLVFITHNRARQAFDAEHNTKGREALWRWGISGDLPIVTVMGPDAQPERLARLLRQYRFLSLAGARFDFVVNTRDGGDYRRPQTAYIMETLKNMGCENILGARGGVHVVDASSSAQDDARLLTAASALVLDGQKQKRRDIFSSAGAPSPSGAARREDGRPAAGVSNGVRAAREMAAKRVKTAWTGEGFRFETRDALPEAAWGHTLANAAFGCLMRDTGCGHVWRLNARENKLTPWDNDPRALQSGETLYIDIDGREVSPFAAADGHACAVTYGFGFARYEKNVENKRVTTTVFVPPDRMARVMIIEVEGAVNARLHHYAELIMGVDRESRRFVVTAWDAENECLTARNAYNTAYHPQTAVFCANPKPLSHTCDISAWREGRMGGQSGAALEPCFGTVTPLTPREGRLAVVVALGAAGNRHGIRRVCELAGFGRAEAELERTKAWWSRRVRPVAVRTPSPALDHYLNGWALYQVIVTRLFARASLYQCGGAYGFRDQLQDVCAALYADPALARGQILRACAHQFEEGDVQHWWHPSKREPGMSDKGVRTRCSDDLLWLPYTVCEYIEKTGDEDILGVMMPYIAAPPLEEGRHNRFDSPRVSELSEDVYS
ncbi:MAG: hypothetical protein FWH06_07435, partial [Oscillospiraceae bacterium]|nr:hypothetical protein [Oscillospiraceae bacterium]